MTCKYCRTNNPVPLIDHDMPVKPYVDECLTGTLIIANNALNLSVDSWDEGGFFKSKKIKYCPVCGRKLGGK